MISRPRLALNLALAARDVLAAEVIALRARVAELEAERDHTESLADGWYHAACSARKEVRA